MPRTRRNLLGGSVDLIYAGVAILSVGLLAWEIRDHLWTDFSPLKTAGWTVRHRPAKAAPWDLLPEHQRPRRLSAVSLPPGPLSSEARAVLEAAHHLVQLDLSGTDADDADVAAILADKPRLKKVTLKRCPITVETLRRLERAGVLFDVSGCGLPLEALRASADRTGQSSVALNGVADELTRRLRGRGMPAEVSVFQRPGVTGIAVYVRSTSDAVRSLLTAEDAALFEGLPPIESLAALPPDDADVSRPVVATISAGFLSAVVNPHLSGCEMVGGGVAELTALAGATRMTNYSLRGLDGRGVSDGLLSSFDAGRGAKADMHFVTSPDASAALLAAMSSRPRQHFSLSVPPPDDTAGRAVWPAAVAAGPSDSAEQSEAWETMHRAFALGRFPHVLPTGL